MICACDLICDLPITDRLLQDYRNACIATAISIIYGEKACDLQAFSHLLTTQMTKPPEINVVESPIPREAHGTRLYEEGPSVPGPAVLYPLRIPGRRMSSGKRNTGKKYEDTELIRGNAELLTEHNLFLSPKCASNLYNNHSHAYAYSVEL